MAETPKKFVESGSKCYTCSCKRVCHIISRAADNSQEVKQEIEEAFKAREKPRAKRLLRSEDGKPDEALLLVSSGNPSAKALKSLRFGAELAPLPLVLLLILTVSPCLILRGLLCTFLVCYSQLEITRIVSCWMSFQINILICVCHVHVSHR